MHNFNIQNVTDIFYYVCNKFLPIIALEDFGGTWDFENIPDKMFCDSGGFLIFHWNRHKILRERTNTS